MEEGTVTVTIEDAPSVPNLKIITIKGSVDIVTSKHVDEKVFPVVEKEKSNIILDLSNLEYLNSIGMLRLTKYLAFMDAEKRFLKLVKPTENVYNSLEAAGIVKHFDMYDTLEAAISSF
jgi:anti-sigma B factor antagonist